MTSVCPECGAVLADGSTCQDRFDQMLVLEFTDPGFGAVHMLSVACFMIQHGRYSDEALVWMERKLRAHLEEGISAEQIRKEMNRETSQARRTWKVTRPPGDPPQPKIAWSVTTASIDLEGQTPSGRPDPAHYRAQVTHWARATLDEMQPLLAR